MGALSDRSHVQTELNKAVFFSPLCLTQLISRGARNPYVAQEPPKHMGMHHDMPTGNSDPEALLSFAARLKYIASGDLSGVSKRLR